VSVLRITIDLDSGEAIESGGELSRILRTFAVRTDTHDLHDCESGEGALLDYNGNRVGGWSITSEPEALQRIHEALDSTEWSASTLDVIADVLRDAGLPIRDPSEVER
jgi:hypothetical protein